MPCGWELAVPTGYSVMLPVPGSMRPIFPATAR
jgi:hypothetical protein